MRLIENAFILKGLDWTGLDKGNELANELRMDYYYYYVEIVDIGTIVI